MSSHHIGGRHGRRVKPRAHQVDYIPRGVQIKNSRDGRRYFMKGGERYYVDKEPRKRSEKMTVTQLSALDGAKVYKDGKTFLAQDGAWTDITGKRKGTELGALIPTMFKTGNVTGGGQYVLPRQPFGGVMTPGDKSFTQFAGTPVDRFSKQFMGEDKLQQYAEAQRHQANIDPRYAQLVGHDGGKSSARTPWLQRERSQPRSGVSHRHMIPQARVPSLTAEEEETLRLRGGTGEAPTPAPFAAPKPTRLMEKGRQTPFVQAARPESVVRTKRKIQEREATPPEQTRLVLKGVKQPDIYGALRKGAQVQQAVEPAHTNISELKRQAERAKAKRRKVAPAPRDFSAGTKQRTTAILDSAMKERSQDMKKEQVRRASREEDEPHMRARRGQGKMRILREIPETRLVPTSRPHQPYSDIKHLLPAVTHAEGVKAKSDWDRKMERTRAANIGGSVPAGPAASIMSREDTRKQRELDVWTEKNKRRLAAGEQALPKPTFDAPRAPTPVQAAPEVVFQTAGEAEAARARTEARRSPECAARRCAAAGETEGGTGAGRLQARRRPEPDARGSDTGGDRRRSPQKGGTATGGRTYPRTDARPGGHEGDGQRECAVVATGIGRAP